MRLSAMASHYEADTDDADSVPTPCISLDFRAGNAHASEKTTFSCLPVQAVEHGAPIKASLGQFLFIACVISDYGAPRDLHQPFGGERVAAGLPIPVMDVFPPPALRDERDQLPPLHPHP